MFYEFMEWIRRMFCRHPEHYFVRNIHGDEINEWDGNRSLWRCKRCGSILAKPELNGDKE